MEASPEEHDSRPAPLVASPAVSPEIGLSEVATLLGCSKSAAAKHTHRKGFPKPRQLARMRVWDRDKVKAWGKKTLPLQEGRPPKQD